MQVSVELPNEAERPCVAMFSDQRSQVLHQACTVAFAATPPPHQMDDEPGQCEIFFTLRGEAGRVGFCERHQLRNPAQEVSAAS